MKKLLQNPVVVGILAIVAVFVVYRSAFSKPAYEAVPVEKPADTVAKGDGSTESESKIDPESVNWSLVELPNPFAPRKLDDLDDLAGGEDQEEIPLVDETESLDLKLSAICRDGEHRFAVINERVVGEGEEISDYIVDKILANHVVLRNSGRRSIIGFPRGRPDAEGQASSQNDKRQQGIIASSST